MKEFKNWKEIQTYLTTWLGICGCQRKIKSIVLVLVDILEKYKNGQNNYTGSEYLILAMLEERDLVTHGINCEYPIIYVESTFWKFIDQIKENEHLIDN